MFACELFEVYFYGRQAVQLETELESIMKKPLNAAPKRLQRMRLRLQKYDLVVAYKKGAEIFLADTLSRAFLLVISAYTFQQGLEQVDHRELLPVSPERWAQIEQASQDDQVLQRLRQIIETGWPPSRKDVPECVHPYFDIDDELTTQHGMVFKSQQLVVPTALRKELIEGTHSTHIGMEGCLRRARESLYWPLISAEIKDFVSKCDVCLSHCAEQAKEPLQPHNLIVRPWSKVGADLCHFDNRLIVDYYSNFIGVCNVTNSPNSWKEIKVLQDVFVRFGIPDTLVSDNGPLFTSAKSATFASMLVSTESSPR